MKKARIFVLAGQSNAVGVGHAEYLKGHFGNEKVEIWRAGFENVKLTYVSHNIRSRGFVPTKIRCAEFGRDTFGPEVGIADLLDERYPGETFYIVKCAFGGMSLWRDWLSPSGSPDLYDPDSRYFDGVLATDNRPYGWCYNELVDLLKNTFAQLEAEGLEPEIKAFFWMQGESDAVVGRVDGYIGLYDALLKDLANEFPGYFDGCVYVDAGISEVWENYEKINEAKRVYAAQSGDRRFIDTIGAGLTTKNEPYGAPDIAHYDSDSVIKLGRLFAEYAF
ncbi:MAG: hypothetical protein IKX86_05990 [Clostridia bacterium]|nr:hypothetical protein [Clostridia bacterium]